MPHSAGIASGHRCGRDGGQRTGQLLHVRPEPVMALHGNTGHAVTYLAGNIIKAEPGLRAEPGCFLYMPLRIAISESAREPARSASTCQPICSPHSTGRHRCCRPRVQRRATTRPDAARTGVASRARRLVIQRPSQNRNGRGIVEVASGDVAGRGGGSLEIFCGVGWAEHDDVAVVCCWWRGG
jgi:hypothetical protein